MNDSQIFNLANRFGFIASKSKATPNGRVTWTFDTGVEVITMKSDDNAEAFLLGYATAQREKVRTAQQVQ